MTTTLTPLQMPEHEEPAHTLHVPPFVVDIAVAVFVLGASVVNLAAQDAAGVSGIPVAGFALLAIGSVSLLWRRSSPLAVLGVALAMTVIWTALGYPGNPVFHILVSLYAVGRYVPERTVSLVALAVALAVIGLGQVTDGDPLSDVVTALLVTALSWYVGRRLRIRADLAAAARERAEYLEWRRATEAQRVIADARAGIARELHDVVAHNVSVMTVQAGVARLVAADDPERAQEAIAAVEEAGRSTLDELRHLLGVLRPETATGELGPQPALSQIHKLAEQLRQTGMSISLNVDITSELPVRVDLFAYRIVQEALTNVLKHGGVDAVTNVSLEEADGYLDIEVSDTGAGTTKLPGSGQGIVGMRECAGLAGRRIRSRATARGRLSCRSKAADRRPVSIRVAVADDQALVRGGFAVVLGLEDDIEVVAEAGDGAAAIEMARTHRPDVILMDIRMPELDGLAATKAIVDTADWPVKVLILTTFDPDEYVYKALRAGASGFVLKDISPEDLVAAVRTVADGGALLAPSVTRRLISRFAAPATLDSSVVARLDRLTSREREVLIALAAGSSNIEIAEDLFVSPATVKSHVSSILTKLGLGNRAQAVAFAYESGLVKPGDSDIGF